MPTERMVNAKAMPRARRAGVVAIFVAALLLALGACNLIPAPWGGISRDAAGRPTRVQIGELAPEIDLVTLAGERIVLSQLGGKPVLVNFWATWCGPCRAEFPVLVRKAKQYHEQGLVILAINTQDPNSDQGVLNFARNTLVTFPLARDRDESVARAYAVRGLPTSVFIDRVGIVRALVYGAMDDAYFDQQLEKIK